MELYLMKPVIIEPSRLRIYILFLCLNFISFTITLIIFYSFTLHADITKQFSEFNSVFFALALYLLISPYFYTSRIFYQANVIVDFDQSKMGCQSCTYSLIKMSMGNKHFITKNDLDIDKTLKRKLTDKIRGVYRIFDKEGYCFIIHKFYFSPENFTLIKMEFLRIYEVDIF